MSNPSNQNSKIIDVKFFIKSTKDICDNMNGEYSIEFVSDRSAKEMGFCSFASGVTMKNLSFDEMIERAVTTEMEFTIQNFE